LLTASGTPERQRAVGSGLAGRQMPLRGAGYRESHGIAEIRLAAAEIDLDRASDQE